VRIIAWHVRGKGAKFKLEHTWWISAIVNYFGKKYPPGGFPVLAAAVTGDKMSQDAVAGATFGPGGPGFVLLQILLLTVVGYMIDRIASVTGHKQLGSMAKTVTLLSSIGLMIGTMGKVLRKIWELTG